MMAFHMKGLNLQSLVLVNPIGQTESSSLKGDFSQVFLYALKSIEDIMSISGSNFGQTCYKCLL